MSVSVEIQTLHSAQIMVKNGNVGSNPLLPLLSAVDDNIINNNLNQEVSVENWI